MFKFKKNVTFKIFKGKAFDSPQLVKGIIYDFKEKAVPLDTIFHCCVSHLCITETLGNQDAALRFLRVRENTETNTLQVKMKLLTPRESLNNMAA